MAGLSSGVGRLLRGLFRGSRLAGPRTAGGGARFIGNAALTTASTDTAMGSANGNSEAPVSRTPWVKFCSACGGKLAEAVPVGEDRYRSVCVSCRLPAYANPKMIVGTITEHAGRVLLCRRAIEPCKGLWTLPAGFQELDESSPAGAARETLEEAQAVVEVLAPFAHLDVPRIGQAYVLFRARLATPFTYGAGQESLEVALFELAEIPWAGLAFSSVEIALRLYVDDVKAAQFGVHVGTVHKTGVATHGEASYRFSDHLRVPTTMRPDGAN